MSREDRHLNLRFKKRAGSPSVDDESCTAFTMAELKKAIAKMKLKGAAGPDDILPMFLKALGPHTLNELLEIFNLSFLH